MRKSLLTFSIRSEADRSLAVASAQIEEAIRCALISSDVHSSPAFEGRAFGMRLVLLAWRGLAELQRFQFAGIPDDPAYAEVQAEYEVCDVSRAVADLLEAHGAGRWWIPSEEEIRAEVKFEEEA
jgi:hypothetical protein